MLMVKFSLLVLLVLFLGSANNNKVKGEESGWPNFGANNQHTGVSQATSGPSSCLLVWNISLGSSVRLSTGGVLLQDGSLLVYDRTNYYYYSLNTTDGTTLWKMKANYTSTTGGDPVIAGNGYIYAVIGGYVSARFPSDGQVKFTVALRDSSAGVLIADQSSEPRVYIGGSQTIFALNATNGLYLWIMRNFESTISSMTLASSKSQVLYAIDYNYLYSVDVNTGAMVTKTYLSTSSNIPILSEDNNLIFISSSYTLIAYNTTTPGAYFLEEEEEEQVIEEEVEAAAPALSQVWRSSLYPTSLVAVQGNMVYVGVSNSLVALNASSGLMKHNLSVGSSISAQSTLDLNGNIYVPISKYYLYALSPTFAFRWIFSPTIPPSEFLAPVLTPAGTLLLSSNNGAIFAFGPTGKACVS